MARLVGFALALVLLTGLAASASADDLWPAPWRGDPLTYFGEWEFEDSLLHDISVTYEYWIGDGIHDWSYISTQWRPDDIYWEEDPGEPGDGRLYTRAFAGRLQVFLGNWIDDYPYKCIWVQITWGGSYGPPYIWEVFGPPWEDPIYGDHIQTYYHTPNHVVEHWMLPINPDCEYVNIWVPSWTWIDEVIIETVSKAEPSSNEPSTWGSIKGLYK
jgi:hypothetical protein